MIENPNDYITRKELHEELEETVGRIVGESTREILRSWIGGLIR